MPDYEWTRDDRGVDTYGKDYPFDAGDKHNFEWVMDNFEELFHTFPDVAQKYVANTLVVANGNIAGTIMSKKYREERSN